MRLFAAVVPPEHVLDELVRELAPVGVDSPELDVVDVRKMRIPVTNFGNVAHGDTVRLLRTLTQEAREWPRPEIRFSGSAALEWPGDENVWARVDGDVDGLLTVGRGVPKAVQPLGFLVDRRVFRPWMAVGSITDHTTAPFLERLVAVLDDFKGTAWTVENLTIMRRIPVEDESELDEIVYEQVPLG